MEDNLGYGPDILTLTDEDGVQHTFEVLDTLELGDNEYYALTPSSEEPEDKVNDSAELIILKVAEDEQGEYMEPVTEEEEYQRVSEIFINRLENTFDFDYDIEDD